MLTPANRRLLKAIMLLSALLPLISLSQVRIKEKVEIKPSARLSRTTATELKMTFHWYALHTGEVDHLMHLGVLEPGSQFKGFNTSTGLATGDYEEKITDNYDGDYFGESTIIEPNPRSGEYYFYAVLESGTQMVPYPYYYYLEIQAPGLVDTIIILDNYGWYPIPDSPYYVNSLTFLFIGPPADPCTGAHFQQLWRTITEVQYGQTTGIYLGILDNCGSTISPPPETYFKYELLGDSLSSGFLRDYITGRTGRSLDSVAYTDIEFDAWGNEPDSPKDLAIRVSAENGSIVPLTMPFTLWPPEVRVLAGKTTLSFGDTTLLTMQVRDPGGEWKSTSTDWYKWFYIANADTFGTLYTLDSSWVSPMIDGSDASVIYWAYPQAEADSDEVIIMLCVSESGGGSRRIPLPAYPDKTTSMTQHSGNVPQSQMTAVVPRKKPGVATHHDMHYGMERLRLKKADRLNCDEVSVNPPNLLAGGTATLTLYIDNGDGTTSSYPAGTTFYIHVTATYGSSDPGTLVAANGSGSELMNAIPAIIYVAPSSFEDDSMEVQIVFVANPSNLQSNASDRYSAAKEPSLSKQPPGALTGTLSKSVLREKIGARLALSSCPLTKTKVRKAATIELTVDPAQLDNTTNMSSILRASLKDRSGVEILGDQKNVTVNYKLGSEGQVYCGLGSGDGPLILDESYANAIGKKVMAWRSSRTFDEIFPLRVKVTASALGFSDNQVLLIVGPHTTGMYYNQGDSPWGNDFYDSSTDSIRKQGCALTAVAMILRAIGVDVDPGSLNRTMVQDGTYGGDFKDLVDFNTAENYSGLTLIRDKDVGKGLFPITKGILDGAPLPDILISEVLSDEDFVIAQVKNYHPENGETNKHFVLITGIRGTDPVTGRPVYSILDPGNSNSTTLQDYSNNVYRLISYRKK